MAYIDHNKSIKLLDKIEEYCSKTDRNILKLRKILSIWYLQHLSGTYFDVIVKDIFVMIKKLVGACIFVDIRNKSIKCDDYDIEEIIPRCPRYCTQYVYDEEDEPDDVHRKYLLTKSYKIKYNIYGCSNCKRDMCGLDRCFYCREDRKQIVIGQKEEEYTRKLMVYYCGLCDISFIMSEDEYDSRLSDSNNVLLNKGVFIEKIYGKYRVEEVNDYVFNDYYRLKIQSIITDSGEYILSKKY